MYFCISCPLAPPTQHFILYFIRNPAVIIWMLRKKFFHIVEIHLSEFRFKLA